MTNADKYLNFANWLRARYLKNGELIISVGLVPSLYSRLELSAYKKYILKEN